MELVYEKGACHRSETTRACYRSGFATNGVRTFFDHLGERWRAPYEPAMTDRPANTATMFHNPQCGTSRKTLEILQEEGVEVTIREYLKDPPGREELAALYRRAGISPAEGLRAKEPLAAQLNLTDADDDTILDAMMKHPILINRPLVETNKGVRLCRPQDVVREIL